MYECCVVLEQETFQGVQSNAVLSESRSVKNISDRNPDCSVTECFKLTPRYLETLIYLVVLINLVTSSLMGAGLGSDENVFGVWRLPVSGAHICHVTVSLNYIAFGSNHLLCVVSDHLCGLKNLVLFSASF